MFIGQGSATTSLRPEELGELLRTALGSLGERRRVLIAPPDITRYHSRAGLLTRLACEYYGKAVAALLPATGTHRPMSAGERSRMFGDIAAELFREHECRHDAVTLGEIGPEEMKELSEGRIERPWPVQVNRMIVEDGFDLVLSLGQVVPHEIAGMANHAKNILVGAGGMGSIDGSHYLGAVYGMERIMGRTEGPVRALFDRGIERYGSGIPLAYALSVISGDGEHVRGLYCGTGRECFEKAAALSQKVNVTRLDRPVKKAVVFCDPSEYRSFWLCNKSIYRTRMMIADGGELVVLAPGVCSYGESDTASGLIGRFGYRGTATVLDAVKHDPELASNLSIAAHLIHGSSEGRFRITYCAGGLDKAQVEAVGFGYGDLDAMTRRYDPSLLAPGFNRLDNDEEVFFIDNPGLGLWATSETFKQEGPR
jgi:nickel-dependent lactate racemase